MSTYEYRIKPREAERGSSFVEWLCVYLAQSVLEVVVQKSIPTQICQLIISNSKGSVNGFLGELTSAKRLYKHFERDKGAWLVDFCITHLLAESNKEEEEEEEAWRKPRRT